MLPCPLLGFANPLRYLRPHMPHNGGRRHEEAPHVRVNSAADVDECDVLKARCTRKRHADVHILWQSTEQWAAWLLACMASRLGPPTA